MLMWWWHQFLSGFLANDHLPRESRQSRLSANGKVDNEVKPGTVHISPGIYLTAEENLGKIQLGDHLIKAVHQEIASNGVLYLQMTFIGSYSTSGRKLEGKKEREKQIYGITRSI